MVEGFLGLLIVVLIVGLVAGVFIFLIRRAPFIPPEFKQWAEYLVLAIALIYLLMRALPMLGVGHL
jgi:cytochrome b561